MHNMGILLRFRDYDFYCFFVYVHNFCCMRKDTLLIDLNIPSAPKMSFIVVLFPMIIYGTFK